jgi:tryptophan synthase alpha chain
MAGKIAEGVIVGSAIVREVEKHINQDCSVLINEVGAFVEELVASTKNQN